MQAWALRKQLQELAAKKKKKIRVAKIKFWRKLFETNAISWCKSFTLDEMQIAGWNARSNASSTCSQCFVEFKMTLECSQYSLTTHCNHGVTIRTFTDVGILRGRRIVYPILALLSANVGADYAREFRMAFFCRNPKSRHLVHAKPPRNNLYRMRYLQLQPAACPLANERRTRGAGTEAETWQGLPALVLLLLNGSGRRVRGSRSFN